MSETKPAAAQPRPEVWPLFMMDRIPPERLVAFEGLRAGPVGVHFHMIDDTIHSPKDAGQRRLVAVALAWGPKWVNEDGSVNHTYQPSRRSWRYDDDEDEEDEEYDDLSRYDEPRPRRVAVPPLVFFNMSCPSYIARLVKHIMQHDTCKVVYGFREAAPWLAANGFPMAEDDSLTVRKAIDLQLYYEHITDSHERNATLPQIAQTLGLNPEKMAFTDVIDETGLDYNDPRAWQSWPLDDPVGDPIAALAQAYVDCLRKRSRRMTIAEFESVHYCAANRRWEYAVKLGPTPLIWFDKHHTARSLECLDDPKIPALDLQCDVDSLLALLPSRFRSMLTAIDNYRERLVDVCLDVGRLPHAYIGPRRRVMLTTTSRAEGDDSASTASAGVVTRSEIQFVLDRLGGASKIDGDNRVGLDGQLHRISAMRSKTGEVYGLTLRVGRTLKHASNYLLDVLLSPRHCTKSVLLVGRPGSGKTTLIRDIARCVSECGENVCVVDTSNEIAGDGLVPHECIGWARRMMVRSLDEQASVMVECVQNHTVETLIVDEIGRKAEVNTAGTVKQRGPRVIASAHGDFRSLIKNQELRGLVGGVQSVIVGDGEAKKNATLGKVQARRAGDPIFDIIVEIDEAVRGKCRIIWDVAQAVDDVMSGDRQYQYETRFHTFGMRGVQVIDS